MTPALWSLLIGVVLIAILLTGTLLARLPMSAAMLYLGLGYLMGPGGFGIIHIDLFGQARFLTRLSEAAVLISLFTIGLKLNIPFRDRRWWIPLRLAFPSMVITVGLIACVGVFGLGMSLGASVLLGGILAPTDPVLASGIQVESGGTPERVRFSLAGEGALNDGSAFPFVLLGLGLLDLHPLGAAWGYWLLVDLLWSTAGGLLIGASLGALIGRLVVHLRRRHKNAVGLDEFLSLGLIAISYGAAQLCMASGFLSVFAAGLAISRVRDIPLSDPSERSVLHELLAKPRGDWATHPHHASSAMNREIKGFNEQLEKLAELAIVLVIGVLLPAISYLPSEVWFIPAVFCVIRPAAIYLGLLGNPLKRDQLLVVSWFGIRGIGSVFYLVFALDYGIRGPLAEDLASLTLLTVATSILVHGISARPLMAWYASRNAQTPPP